MLHGPGLLEKLHEYPMSRPCGNGKWAAAPWSSSTSALRPRYPPLSTNIRPLPLQTPAQTAPIHFARALVTNGMLPHNRSPSFRIIERFSTKERVVLVDAKPRHRTHPSQCTVRLRTPHTCALTRTHLGTSVPQHSDNGCH